MFVLRLLRNPMFMVSSLFTLGILFSSIGYYFIKNDVTPVVGLLYDENGELLKHPYSPMDYPPFGTDHFGRPLLNLILIGSKYTLGIAFVVAFLRLCMSAVIGVFLGMFVPKWKKWIASVVDASNYFPATLLGYFILVWVMIYSKRFGNVYTYSLLEHYALFVTVFTLIAIPTISVLVMNETDRIMKKEFIEGVKVLGAGKRQIIRKHLMPYLVPQFCMIFLRELVQVLLLLAHLGLLMIFVGGYAYQKDMYNVTREFSISNEWSGLLGLWWEFIWAGSPWITAVPVLFFTVTILSVKMALIGFEKEYNNAEFMPRVKRKPLERTNKIPTKADFQSDSVDFNKKHSVNE
ncbi:ABC transporter permease subunit [Alkalihalobacillus sp. AL-G]|uniref:ABC transporter permease subunit n=1 Tax=Alkalihalobacillus sp. AL-G TaxID=2926399 RepID=UPI00272A7911|nr:ABC transporter permease subunit [Alkalihalobacillus sp. AL-G]WLD93607.1 ABC transporter permease subunit [Alkalihalobacillus sp. AL-G]